MPNICTAKAVAVLSEFCSRKHPISAASRTGGCPESYQQRGYLAACPEKAKPTLKLPGDAQGGQRETCLSLGLPKLCPSLGSKILL